MVLVFVVGVGDPRRGDRRRAPARAVLRRLDDRLGEHDRRSCSSRCRSATGTAAGWPTATRRSSGLCRSCCSPRSLLAAVPFVGRPVPRLRRSTRSTRSRPARSSARCSASRARRGPGAPARRRRAVRAAPRADRRRRERARRRAPVRDLDGRLAARHVLGRAAADPARRHAAHVPDLRARCSRCVAALGLRAGAASLAPARARRSLLALPVGTRQGGRATASVIHEADTEYQYARVDRAAPTARARSSSTRVRRSTRSTARRLPDRRLLGRACSCCRSRAPRAPPRADRDPRQRRRHDRPRVRPLLPATRGSTRSRSTAS